MVPFCNPFDCFSILLWQPRWKSKAINMKNYRIPGIPGALQFTSPKHDVHEIEFGQIYKRFGVLKPFWVAFGQLFLIKSERGVYLRGTFTGINTVGNKSILIQPSRIIYISCISNVFRYFFINNLLQGC